MAFGNEPLPDDQPKVVGRYELLQVLGEGGIATTFLARDLDRGRPVAVKAIQLVKARNRRQIEMFEREAEALKGLQHAQIPTFYETMVGESEETITLYLVQQFVEGHDLLRRLEEGYRFDPAEVVAIMASCLEPLEYLHRLDPPLYHRDIKPSNIIMKADGTCVLVDFGAVREALADPKVAGSSVVGTFGYMAPEQFQARACAATDLYSLGATSVHLLSGRSPDSMEVKRLKPDIHQYLDLDPRLAAILDLLLEPAAEDRYQSVASLRRALARWIREQRAQSERQLVTPTTRAVRVVSRDTPTHPQAHQALPPEPAIRPAPTSVPAEVTSSPRMALDEVTGPMRPVESDPATPTRRAKRRRKTPFDVPIKRVHDGWASALSPASVGCEAVGGVLLVLGAALMVLGVWRSEAAAAPVLIGLALAIYGGLYFVLANRRRRRQRGDQYIDTADGSLTQVDLRTSGAGTTYVMLHYQFEVDGKTFAGRHVFPDRDVARPFLRPRLPRMVHYDYTNPARSALDRPAEI